MAKTQKTSSCPDCINKSYCFSKLTHDELHTADKNRAEVTFKKNEIICKQGAFATHILYIKDGLAKVYIEGPYKNLIIKILKNGELIGLPSLYGSNIHHYTVSSVTETTVCLIDINVFRSFIKTNANFASEIIRYLNQNTVEEYEKFINLTQKQLHGRVADALIYLQKDIYKNDVFEMHLSRKDLADLTGMSIESVIRILKDLKKGNIIDIQGKKVEIKNLDQLMKTSATG